MNTEITTTNNPAPALSDAEFRAEIEVVARQIEHLERSAIFKIANRLAWAHEQFLYRRDEGGFQGWVEDRLGYSRSQAYRLLDVAKLIETIPDWDTFGTLPVTAVYQIAAASTPVPARDEILDRIKAGERMSCAMVAEVVAKAKGETITITSANSATETKNVTTATENRTPETDETADDTAISAAARKAFYAGADGDGVGVGDHHAGEGNAGTEDDHVVSGVGAENDHEHAGAEDSHGGAGDHRVDGDGDVDHAGAGDVDHVDNAGDRDVDRVGDRVDDDHADQAGDAVPPARSEESEDDRLIREGEVAAAEYTRLVKETLYNALADYYELATPADIYNRIPDDKRKDVLAAFSVEHVIEVFGEQLRTKLPANPILKLREMDTVTAASTIYEAFGAGRFEAIVAKVHDLITPKGKKTRKSGKPFKTAMTLPPAGTDASGNPNFAQEPRGNRSRH